MEVPIPLINVGVNGIVYETPILTDVIMLVVKVVIPVSIVILVHGVNVVNSVGVVLKPGAGLPQMIKRVVVVQQLDQRHKHVIHRHVIAPLAKVYRMANV